MFILPLLERGARNPLQDKDLDHLSKDHCMPELVDRLEARWEVELRKKKPSLRCAFFHLLRKEIIVGGIFTFLLSVTRISQAVLLGVILSWMTLWSQKTETQHANATYANVTGNVTAHSLVNMTMALNIDQTESVTVGFVAAFALIAVATAKIWFHHTMVNSFTLLCTCSHHHYFMSITVQEYNSHATCLKIAAVMCAKLAAVLLESTK